MKRVFQLHLALLTAALSVHSPAAVSPEACLDLRNHGHRSDATDCFEALSRSSDLYLRAEGLWGLQQYKSANDTFRAAVDQPGAKSIYRVRWGLLLHERFNNSDAVGLFREALVQDPNNARAYLGLALVSSDGFDSKADEYTRRAILLNPQLVEAHELMAHLALENAQPEEAIKEADKAIALAPQGDALGALAIRAAVDLLADRSPDAWFARIKAINPASGEPYALVAHHLVLNRRYTDGVAYYRKAIEVEPRLWSAHSQLGINLMRLGQEKEPFEQLELAYNNGWTDAETTNSLKLLDSYKTFVTTRDQTTILRLREKEARLLRPYFEQELHRSIAAYEKKYKFTLPAPVQLEVYPDHEDFAVRTMGLPGLGALGVTFGEVVAMDSPAGRKPGDFNWGSTLWHEMSHVFILTLTNHRVPRWFTEGLAVHEEGEASPEWSNRLTPEVVLAIRDKKLLSVSQMDRGFIYPEYPSQVIVSYFQAGTICDYIKQRWGNEALLGMVHSFAARKSTSEAIQENLSLSPESFDVAYMAWLQKRVGETVANFDTWKGLLRTIAEKTKAKDYEAVIAVAPNAIRLYPEYIGDANAYEFLAEAHLAQGTKQAAADTLTAYEKMGGEKPEALKKLASIEEELGQKEAAAETLNRLNFIYPEDEALHRHLGSLLLAQGKSNDAVREYSAALAMNPLDRASVEYDLAQAYLVGGDPAKAEENVLDALESAPGFRPAQKLLLELESHKSSVSADQTRQPK